MEYSWRLRGGIPGVAGNLLLPPLPTCDYFHKLDCTAPFSRVRDHYMATESILRPGELKDILLREIASADLATENVSEVGTVLEVRDGVARIYGLKSAIASEMLEFTAQETGETVAGLVLNLEEDNVGAAVMGDYLKLKEGDQVRRTGRLLDVPVGPAMLGRVVNALGEPVDGL